MRRWWPSWSLLGIGQVARRPWTWSTTGVAPVRPTCWCRSSVAADGCITRCWCRAVDPLPHLPAPSGRRRGLALRLIAVGYGHELLALLADWSCIQDGSPRLRPEAGGFSGATGKSTARAIRPWAVFHILRRITGSYIGRLPASVPKTLLDNVACLLRR